MLHPCCEAGFNTVERPAARPLPREMPEPGHIESGLKVQRNYCVKVNGHGYSVDTKYIGMEAEARVTLSRVEIRGRGQSHALKGGDHDRRSGGRHPPQGRRCRTDRG